MKSHCPGLLTLLATGVFKGEESNLNGDDYNGLDAFFLGYGRERNKVFLKISILPKYYMTVTPLEEYSENISRFSTCLYYLSVYHRIPLFFQKLIYSVSYKICFHCKFM